MKRFTTLLAQIIFLIAALPAVATPVVVHIVGSSANRYCVNLAILRSFDGGTQVNVGATASSFNWSDISYFHGTMGGTDTIVETRFEGSTAGIAAITKGWTTAFLPDDLDQTAGATIAVYTTSFPNFSTGYGLNTLPTTNQVTPDAVLSDLFQSSTTYRSPVLQDSPSQAVGVVPYVWIRTPSANSSVNAIDNMTRQTATLLYGNGSLPLAFWSGLSSDEGSILYAAGRNPDASSRVCIFAECGQGITPTVVQYHPTNTGSDATAVSGLSQTGSITAIEVFPDTSGVGGRTFLGGNGGEWSDSYLSNYMSKVFNIGTPGALIAYCSLADAISSVKWGAVPIAWNGVSIIQSNGVGNQPTVDLTPIMNGTYTYWSYEHVLYLSGQTTAKKSVANRIANLMKQSFYQIPVSNMRVSRQVDGGYTGPVY